MPESTDSIQENAAVGARAASRKLNWQAAGRALRHRNFQLLIGPLILFPPGTSGFSMIRSWLTIIGNEAVDLQAFLAF